MTGVFCR